MAKKNKKIQKEKKRKEKIRKEKLKFESYLKNVISESALLDKLDEAYLLIESENYDKAKKILLKLRTKDINQTEIFFALGIIAINEDKFDKALECFNNSIELSPDNHEAYFNLGSIYAQKRDIPEMIYAFRKCIELGTKQDPNVIRAQATLDNFENNLKSERGINLDTLLKEYEIFRQAGDAMESKKWRSAINTFKQLMIVNPRNVQVHGNMGICYSRLGKIEKALYHLDRALEIDPEYGLAIHNREMIIHLKEGECLDHEITQIDYYKEKSRLKN